VKQTRHKKTNTKGLIYTWNLIAILTKAKSRMMVARNWGVTGENWGGVGQRIQNFVRRDMLRSSVVHSC
jgi:hypothetical protein